MEPDNPNTNNTPLIYRICDAAGVFHLVAPVNHTHTYQDVPGLAGELNELWSGLNEKANAEDVTEALAGKANAVAAGSPSDGIIIAGTSGELVRSNKTLNDFMPATTVDSTPTTNSDNLVTSGGVKAALDEKANTLHGHTSIQDEADAKSASVIASEDTVNIEVRNEEGGGECAIKPSNIGNLIRALSNPDTTPTANSTKLVTSGGVKAALDGKAPEGDTEVIFEEGENIFVHLPNYFSNGERQRSFILNYQGEQKELIELFGCSTHDMIRILSHDESIITVSECYIAVRVIKQPSGVEQGDVYYIIFDGRTDY